MTVPVLPRLRARTLETPPQPDLFDLIPSDVDPRSVLSWVREGSGLVGWGRAASSAQAGTSTAGPDRFALAAQWWRDVVAGAEIEDELNLPGTGLVAFGSFAFAPESPDGGGLVVPRVVAGQHDGRAWVTSIEAIEDESVPSAPQATQAPEHSAGPTPGLTLRDGAVPAREWPSVIATAIERIEAGEVDKVVLARDVLAVSDRPIDTVTLLRRLAQRYAATWTFAVDGLVGATPEMLVRLQHGRVRSRVLAGTVRRDQSPAPSVTEPHPELEEPHTSDPRLHLVSSAKDLEEHAFAVRSVAEALTPHCASLDVPEEPFVLELPDVYHLATDLSGEAGDDATSLDLAAALHPSAAVCGTPSEVAARLISELERMDRGRYAGPVGWMGASGDGDWGIALRCGQLTAQSHAMRLFAGGGIVAASDPQAELAETEVKLAAMRHALGLGS
ncbi:isochorismate synthase [Ornithinimicrobium ciconiae]|uniref:isochorismate synthase n=1 Tax=Ornithinimicrobium ciconiae TaxID=2594265 RepID=A0A516G862_9MICO|nr:isochorismate synthase [Ornithinimicrobium ciconiae]QDO87714.1 isochorismate synthase [Ornithinimicrobium ciconiae]